ncbi:MAG: HD domain-containing protein, partial [Acidimicrobiia bacterium]
MSTPEPKAEQTARDSFDRVLDAYLTRHQGADTAVLEQAFETADRLHEGQVRKTGEAFIFHPLAVTQMLADYGLDEATLAAGILHDTVEDTDVNLDDLRKDFGGEVADLIDGVTKLD